MFARSLIADGEPMPEEDDQEKQVEDEMLRMMQEEEEEEEGQAEEAGEPGEASGEDLEAEMLRAMQEETAAGGGQSGGDDADLEAQMLQAMMAETGASSEVDAQEALQKTQSLLPGQELSSKNIGRLIDIRLTISIELGQTKVPISTLLGWTEGSLIELEKVSGEPVDVLVNGSPFARGEVVVISENFGVRLTEIRSALPPR